MNITISSFTYDHVEANPSRILVFREIHNFRFICAPLPAGPVARGGAPGHAARPTRTNLFPLMVAVVSYVPVAPAP